MTSNVQKYMEDVAIVSVGEATETLKKLPCDASLVAWLGGDASLCSVVVTIQCPLALALLFVQCDLLKYFL